MLVYTQAKNPKKIICRGAVIKPIILLISIFILVATTILALDYFSTYEPYDYLPPAPTFVASGGELGQLPPFTITFVFNDGLTPNYTMQTDNYGEICCCDWPYTDNNPRISDGAHLWEWTRTPSFSGYSPWAWPGQAFYEDTTVYAQWIHEVKFYVGNWYLTSEIFVGHSINSLLEYLYDPNDVNLPDEPFVQDYRFMGWYTRGPGGSLDQPFSFDTIITADTYVYPRLEPFGGIGAIFDPRNGTPHANFEVRLAGPNGTIGSGNMPQDPQNPGYQFIGWAYCCCMRTFDGDYEIQDWQSPLSVFALWGVTVTFNCDYTILPGGTGYDGFDPRLVIPHRDWQPHMEWPYVAPTRTGYIFRGWYRRNSEGELVYPFNNYQIFTEDTDLFARWEVARTVIFDPNGGTTIYGQGVRQVDVNGWVTSLPNPPNRGGHRFMGWTRTPDGLPSPEVPYYYVYFNGQMHDHEESPLTVYALWGFRVNFICMHPDRQGVNWQPQSVDILANKSAVETHNMPWNIWVNWPEPGNNVLPGPEWRFAGWSENIDINNPGTFITEDSSITSEMDLFAHWVLRPQFTVTFDLDAGTLGTHPGSAPYLGPQTTTRQAWCSESVWWSSRPTTTTGGGGGLNEDVAWRFGAPEVLRNLDNDRGVTVGSWWTLPGGEVGGGQWWSSSGHYSVRSTASGRSPHAGASRPVTEDITVYPEWVFRVTFHPNFGTHTGGSLGPGLWTPGAHGFGNYNVRDIPVGPGYQGGTVDDDGFLRTASQQSSWVWTVDQNGEPVGEWVVIPMGTKVPLGMPAPGSVTRNNHLFLGWWTEQIPNDVPLGDEPATAQQFFGNEIVDRNMTVYARWYQVPFELVEVTFDVNGGQWPGGLTGTRSSGQFQQGTNMTNSRMPQIPTREGYIFMGWYRQQHPDGTQVNIATRVHSGTTINQNTHVYAHWERYWIVHLHPNGGTHPDGIPYRRVAHNRTFGQMGNVYSPSTQSSGRPVPPTDLNFYSITGRGSGVFGSPLPQWLEGDVQTRFTFNMPFNFLQDGSGQVLTPSVPITGNVTVYAQWLVRITYHSNLETFVAGGGSFTRETYVAAGFSIRQTRLHPHAQMPYCNGGIGTIIVGDFPTPQTWLALINPLAANIGYNFIPDGSGAPFDIDTVVHTSNDVYGIWTTHVRFLQNGAPESAIPFHDRERMVAHGYALYTGVCPFTGTMGMPDDPVWPGLYFSHWNDCPLATGVTLIANDPLIWRPTAIYAIWHARVYFNATGGTSRTQENNVDLPIQIASEIRGRHIVSDARPFGMARPGWTFVEWNTARWGLLTGNGAAFDPETLLFTSIQVYAQWRANITFNLQGGHIDGNFSNVVRQVLEHDTIQENGGIPTPVRPGYTFAGWRYANGDPIPANFATLPWEDGHTTVFAGWDPIPAYFEFIKSTYVIYDGYPPDPLPGAVFRILRLVQEGDGDPSTEIWEQIGPDVTSQNAPPYGLVRLEGLTLTGTYRLVEYSAPRGFHTPVGHWTVSWNRVDPMDHTTWIPTAVHYGEAPEFLRRPIAGSEPPVYRLYVGNMPARERDFVFRKTNQNLYTQVVAGNNWGMTDDILLGGAIFELFRFNGDNPPADLLVTPNNVGDNPGQWSRVDAVTSSDDPGEAAMTLSLTVVGIYHLVEAVAPVGFMTPHGQWRIWVDDEADGGFEIEPVGCAQMQTFFWNQEDTFYVANLPGINLPMSGGLGMARYYLAGIGIIIVAVGAWFLLRRRHGNLI